MKNPFQYNRRNPEIVEAVQYKAQTFEGRVILPVWILEAVRDEKIRTLAGNMYCGNKAITEGDYIVKSDDDRVFVISESTFNSRYERAPEPA